jgi:inner membrane transporter RhtA
MEPQGVTALRVTLAALSLLAVWRPWRAPPGRREWPWIAAYGVSLGVMNLLFYMAIARIPLGVAVALEFTGPLVVAMAGSRRPVDFLWVALAAIGVALLSPLLRLASPLDTAGILYALAAGACWAGYILFGQKAGSGGPGSAAALGMLVAAVVALPSGAAVSGLRLLDPAVLPAALGVAVLSSALPYSLEMFALSRMPRRVFGISVSLEPALGALAGLAVLHERLAASQLAAIACVIGASVGSAATARRSAAALPQPD